MKIIWLITVGSILLSIATSDNDFPITNNFEKLSRKLILKPRILVTTKDDDETPFDFISNWLSRIMNSLKTPSPSNKPPRLGPIHVSGLDEQVFIDNLQSMPHPRSHVLLKIMKPSYNNIPMTMPLGINSHRTPNFPKSSTQRMPMHSGGFHRFSSPAPNLSWSPHINNIYGSSNNIKNDFKNNENYYKNLWNTPEYFNNLISNRGNQKKYHDNYQNQWQPQQFSYNSHNRPTISYNNPNFHNNFTPIIPKDVFTNYEADSLRSTNYVNHSINQKSIADTRAIGENESVKNGKKNYNKSPGEGGEGGGGGQEKIQYNQFNILKVTPTPTKELINPSELIEIYRSDRMVLANTTTPRNHIFVSTTESTNNYEIAESSEEVSKYSLREIEEIPSPNLKVWQESIKYKNDNKNSDSRINNEDEIIMRNGMTLGKGESQEHIHEDNKKIHMSLTEPTNKVSRTISNNTTRKRNSFESSKEEEDNSVPKINSNIMKHLIPAKTENIMIFTMDKNTSQYSDIKRPSRRKLSRFKNNETPMKIVESVKSSISMTSSRGHGIKKKLKSKN